MPKTIGSSVQFIDQLLALPEVEALFQALNQSGVRYCQWKSSYRLEEALLGKTDLDLLIDRDDKESFLSILHEFGVREFDSLDSQEYPEFAHYLGMDLEAGDIYHLHVQDTLVIGSRAAGFYHLPLEAAYFDSPRFIHGIRVAPVELELAILAVRSLLKYSPRLGLRDQLDYGSPGIPSKTAYQIGWLLEQTNLDQAERATHDLQGDFPFQAALEFLHLYTQKPRDGFGFLRLKQQLLEELKPYQIRSDSSRKVHYPSNRLAGKNVDRNRYKLVSPGGGQMIAFIGVDGAGKSTMVNHLASWLSRRLVVEQVYLGGGRPLTLTTWLSKLAELGYHGYARLGRIFGEGSLPQRMAFLPRELLHGLYYLSAGLDRYRRYAWGAHKAAQGAIVLCDKYPIASLVYEGRSMDGPRIIAKSTWRPGLLGRAMARIEAGIYRRISLPDQLFVLQVSQEVSFDRKPDHDEALLTMKNQALAEWLEENENTLEIDADRPASLVLHDLKKKTWDIVSKGFEGSPANSLRPFKEPTCGSDMSAPGLAAQVSQAASLPAIHELFERLNATGIRYSMQKKNFRMAESLEGRCSLELSVPQEHKGRFVEILHSLDIKRFIPSGGKVSPGSEHWLGFDSLCGQLFHLNVRFERNEKEQRALREGSDLRNLAPENGGKRLAFIGLDGAGKSTLLRHSLDWLSTCVHVERCYLGNGEPSWMTRTIDLFYRAAHRSHRLAVQIFGSGTILARAAAAPVRTFEQLGYVSTGRDRYRRYLKSLEEAGRGTIIFYERYPLDAVRFDGRMIDGPKIAYLSKGNLDALGRKLAAMEEAYYRKIGLPDQIIFLKVNPEFAFARKPEHDLALLTAKARSYDSGVSSLNVAWVIDADQPYDRVFMEVKKFLWKAL